MPDDMATREILAEILTTVRDTNMRLKDVQQVMETIGEQVGPAISMVQNIPMLKMMLPKGK